MFGIMPTVAKTLRTSSGTVASASAGPYVIGFRLFDDDTLKVYVNDLPRTDWTISSSYENGYDDSASITFDSSLEIADTWRIDGSLTPARADDLTNGGIGLTAKLNIELARVWSVLAEHGRDIGRAVRGFAPIDPAAGINAADVANAQENAEAAAASADAASDSANLAASLAPYETPQQYGAVADGVTDDTAAFVAALAANDIIYAGGNFVVSTPIDVDNKMIVLDGTITGSITGNRTKIFRRTATAHNPFNFFGGFFTRDSETVTTLDTHANSFVGKAIVMRPTGSGENGPTRTDLGFMVENTKKDYLTSSVVGEIDGQYITVYQGAYSDAGALLVDIRKVQGGDGGAVGFECAAAWVNSSGTRQYATQSIVGFMEGAGGTTGSKGAAFGAEARVGTPFAGYMSNNRSDLSSAFDWHFYAGLSRSPSDQVFGVAGATGDIYTKGKVEAAQIGFNAGAGVGGTVTQATSKVTLTTLNKRSGTITTAASALAANTRTAFRFNNSTIGENSVVILNIKSPTNKYSAIVGGQAAGYIDIQLTNLTGGSLSEAVVIGFAVIDMAVD